MNELLELEPDIDLAIVDVDTNIELVHTFEGKKQFMKIFITILTSSFFLFFLFN